MCVADLISKAAYSKTYKSEVHSHDSLGGNGWNWVICESVMCSLCCYNIIAFAAGHCWVHVLMYFILSIKHCDVEMEDMEGVGSLESLSIASLLQVIVLLQTMFQTMPQNSPLWQSTLQTLLRGFPEENVEGLSEEDA